MNVPESLTIVDGALAMDGGSIFLKAIDDGRRQHTIFLNWAIAAQKEGGTSLWVDDQPLTKQSHGEGEWVRAIASAQIVPAEAPYPSGERISANPLMLAKDAEAVLTAGERSVVDGLTALRDSLLQKVRSPGHAPTTRLCPTCGDSNTRFNGGAGWSLHCDACGYEVSGTAEFAIHGIEREVVFAVFKLKAISQIIPLRNIVRELAGFAVLQLAEEARNHGMTLRAGPLAEWRAQEYIIAAAGCGIEGKIEEQ